MTQKSPFSLFYNTLAHSNNVESISLPLQNPNGAEAKLLNFQPNLPHIKPNKSAKRQTKIKVFGLSDQKRGKEEKHQDLCFSQNQTNKNTPKVQQDFNLLESKTFSRNEVEQKFSSGVEIKQQSISELNKLLGLCEQTTPHKPQQMNEQIEKSRFSNVKNQQQGQSRQNQSRFQGNSVSSMAPPSQKIISLSQNQQNSKLDKFQTSSKKQIFFDKTESRFLPSELGQKSVTPFSSKVQSRIIDLIAQMTQSVKTPASSSKCMDKFEPQSNKNSNALICDLSRMSKNASISNTAAKNNKTYQENISLTKAKSCSKFGPAPTAQLQKQGKQPQTDQCAKKRKQAQKQSKPFIPLPKKPTKQNVTNLGEYLNHYGSYEKEIQNLIGRYQKVKQLKYKQIEIRQELQHLTHKNQQTYRNCGSMKDYYFPEDALEKSHSSIKLCYKNKLQHASPNSSQHQLKNHNKNMSYESDHATDTLNPHLTDLQRQLNRNVENIQKIIKELKKKQKRIEAGSSKNYSALKTQHKKLQKNRRSLLEEHYFTSSTLRTNTKKSQNIQMSNPPETHDLCQSSNLINSVEMTQNYKKAIKRQLTLQQFYNTRMPDKRTSRTQKKYHFSSEKQILNKKQECNYEHELLLKQIKRLNDKIASLEVAKEKKLSNVGSQNLRQHTSNLSIEQVQSDEQPSVDVSIPPQSSKKTENLYQANQSYQYLKITKQQLSEDQGGQKSKNNKQKHEIKEKTIQKLIKKRQQSEQDQCFKQKAKKNSINFPIFYSFPSERDSLSQLVEIGSYMFRILYKFAISRKNRKIRQISDNAHFRVKKCSNFIDYSTQNQLNYHLAYYFKGSIYFGQWGSQVQGPGYRHGQGYYFHPHKYVYQGQFILDKKQGYGIAQYANKEYYEGYWRRNKKQGKGVLINAMGDYFKGEFKAGKKHGRGREQLSNGDFYKGQFKCGKIDGQGKYVWSDGSSYKGQFKEGKLNGNGIWKSKQNDLYEGKFKDNKKQGEGVYKWSNGIMYAGYFLQDQQRQLLLQEQQRKGRMLKKRGSCQQTKRSKTKERERKKRS